jgi:lysophospholipid acyltransferase (LPLAT)-like uncharacterized protein
LEDRGVEDIKDGGPDSRETKEEKNPSSDTLAKAHKPRGFFLNWPRILSFLISLYYKLVRFKFFGNLLSPSGTPMIYIVWHAEEVTMLPRCGFTQGNVMVSRSRDGDILAAVISRWGYRVSRGSSSKGAVAALRLLRDALKRGESIILAVDGPRGPRRKAKPGAFYLSQTLKVPICPVGVAISRFYTFKKSWSHSRLPLPLAKVAGVFGELYTPSESDLTLTREEQCHKLEELLEAATEAANNRLKNWSASCT